MHRRALSWMLLACLSAPGLAAGPAAGAPQEYPGWPVTVALEAPGGNGAGVTPAP